MADTKSTDLSINLIHYLVALLQKHSKDLLSFYEDMPSVGSASKIAIQSITEGLKFITGDLAATTKAVELVDKSTKGDKFHKVIGISFSTSSVTDIVFLTYLRIY